MQTVFLLAKGDFSNPGVEKGIEAFDQMNIFFIIECKKSQSPCDYKIYAGMPGWGKTS
jgi:hypothetical protein